MTTVEQLANELNKSVQQILQQLQQAGINKNNANDEVLEEDKQKLLNFLKRSHGTNNINTSRLTLSTTETSHIRQSDSTGKTRTVEVAVKKRRIIIKDTNDLAAVKTDSAMQLLDNNEENKKIDTIIEQQSIKEADFETKTVSKDDINNKKNIHNIDIGELNKLNKSFNKGSKIIDNKKEPSSLPINDKNLPEEIIEKKEDKDPIEIVVEKKEEPKVQLTFAQRRALAEAQAKEISQMLNKPNKILRAERKKEAEKAAEPVVVQEVVYKTTSNLRITDPKAPAANSERTERRPLIVKTVTPNSNNSIKKDKLPSDGSVPPSDKKEEVKEFKDKPKSKFVEPKPDKDQKRKTGMALKIRGDATSDLDGAWRSPKSHKKHKPISNFIQPTETVIKDIIIPETISVADLAHKMSVKGSELIKVLMKLGQMVTINQVLDQDTAMILTQEMGHVAIPAKSDDPESFLEDNIEHDDLKNESLPRPPVVTVMGHVDHGKTSLLDKIRSSKVAFGEAGGITQHIGAYHVDTPKGMITFLDTPGHEAFTAMRARGAKATDIVILVVAADDGVMPQTKEAIAHAKAANVPLVVAINKSDKPDANIDKVTQELVAESVIPEAYGGDVPFIAVSAKTGDGIDALLENVLLQAEVLELKAPIEAYAKGLVIEAKLDKGKGAVATILVQSGTLKKGDMILAGAAYGRVRAMVDENGKSIQSAGPSIPVEIQGLSEVPGAGDEVIVVPDERKAREIALFRQGKFRDVKLARQQASKLENMFENMAENNIKSLSLIIKSDVQGSQEALVQSLNQLSGEEVRVQVVHAGVGAISDNDINLAAASQAVIIGFNVRADAAARKLAENLGINIKYYNIIYDAVNDIKAALSGLLSPEIKEKITGSVEIRQVIKVPKIGLIAGCMVTDGFVKRSSSVRVLRDNIVIFTGELDSLKRFKDDVKEVKQGFECGLSIKNYQDLVEKDVLEIFETVEIARTL